MKDRVLNRRKIDCKGALEGLPLYLIILVVIAGIGTAIIAGWMMGAESTELDHIEIEGAGSDDTVSIGGDSEEVTITAYDQNGNGLEGATVTLEGCGVSEIEKTNSDGEATFTDLENKADLPSNENFGEIQVTVKYTGDMTKEKQGTVPVKA